MQKFKLSHTQSSSSHSLHPPTSQFARTHIHTHTMFTLFKRTLTGKLIGLSSSCHNACQTKRRKKNCDSNESSTVATHTTNAGSLRLEKLGGRAKGREVRLPPNRGAYSEHTPTRQNKQSEILAFEGLRGAPTVFSACRMIC